jgi:hypothetical protein
MSLRKAGVLALLIFCIAGCGNQYMRKIESKPEIKADPSKATLVIYRMTSYGFVKEIHNYLDKTYIGTTKGKCYFVAKVDPGSHYVIGDAENKACAKVNFEANKVYFLNQTIFMGVMSARTGFIGGNLKEFEEQKNEMDYEIINPEEKGPTLDDGDYKETVADFEKEDKEDPKKHEDTNNLKGY